jgi:murein DD-endopeptidase MepM/ murein hydrolase activator NlpD
MIRRPLLFAFCLLPFLSCISAAEPKILLSATSIFPGETLRVEVDGVTPNEPMRLGFSKGFFPLFVIGPDAQRGLLGIRLDAVPGKYPLKLQRYGKKSGRWEAVSEESIEISSKTFPIEVVSFNPEKTELTKWEHQESARIHKLLMSGTPEQMWEGAFDFPVQGPIIGEFGIKRVRKYHYAGKDTAGADEKEIDAGFHKGYDFKAKKGTPVLASAPGVVVLASTLKAHGRTVLINHGQGVMTIYLHLNSMSVTPGQKVVKGQKVGAVGSSGLSTAPHVHWGLYVHGVPVDGKVWTETEF